MTDEELRERIPTREQCPTLYRPLGGLVMITPLPSLEKIGSIIIPNRAQQQAMEGHIIELGTDIPAQLGLEVGDAVTWSQHHEFRMDIDGVKFVLVPHSAIIMIIKKATLEAAAAKRAASEPAQG